MKIKFSFSNPSSEYGKNLSQVWIELVLMISLEINN